MATTTQVTTFLDLFTDLQNRVRSQTGITVTQDIAKRFINTALHDMHLGLYEKFQWSERRNVLVTQPQYQTGTVSVSKGGTSVTGVSTAWTTVNEFGVANVRVGGKIRFGGSEEVYEVATVSGALSLTIASRFVSEDISAETYTYFEDEYALESDFLRPIDQQRFSQGGIPIDLIGRTEFRRRYPKNNVTGRPKIATILDLPFSGSTTPVRKIKFHRPPDRAYMINYAYITSNLAVTSAGAEQAALSADTDEPIVPIRARHAIVFHALYHWYRDRQDDVRSQTAQAEYANTLARIVGDTEIGQSRAQLRPRQSVYKSRARRPWSGGRRGSRRYDVDGAFDRLE